MTFRSIFFGTPEFAVPCFRALAEISEVVACVCQPDRPKGRGNVLTPPPVKVCAAELGVSVVQPTKLRTGELGRWLREQQADVALVVAYGRILPLDVLQAPRLGCINVHASLLPKYRGAAPITWAVVDGEHETGITVMKLDEGMDTGPMLDRIAAPIDPDETAGDLSVRLAEMGANAVRTGLPKYVRGESSLVAQDEANATVARMLTKEDGRIDWSKTATEVHNHVRGMNPWPGAFTLLEQKVVKIHRTRIVVASWPNALPGTVVLADKSRVVVSCGKHAIELDVVQLEGRKPMRGFDWVIGRGVREQDRLI